MNLQMILAPARPRQLALLGTSFSLSLLVTFSCKSTNPGSSQKSLNEVSNIYNNAGLFTVTCKRPNSATDLYLETYDEAKFQQAVSTNSICNQGGSSSEVFCEPYTSGQFFVSRLSDMQRLTDRAVDLPTCNSFVSASRNGFSCAPYSGDLSQLMQISTKKALGNNIENGKCISAVTSSIPGLVCTAYSGSLYNITSIGSGTIGSSLELENCLQIVSVSNKNSNGLTCSRYSGTLYNISRIADGQTIGATTTQENCVKIITGTSNRLACVPSNASTFELVNISTGAAVGSSRMPLDQCLKIANNQ